LAEITFHQIPYGLLKSKQKEAYNLQKVSAIFADLGFVTIRMTSDWGDADFIAQHIDGIFLKVQLKSRLSFYQEYRGKSLFICFPFGGSWYLYPHDEMLDLNLGRGYIGKDFWNEHGGCTTPKPAKGQLELLEPYHLRPGITLSL
jgi:hypothetical protein